MTPTCVSVVRGRTERSEKFSPRNEYDEEYSTVSFPLKSKGDLIFLASIKAVSPARENEKKEIELLSLFPLIPF